MGVVSAIQGTISSTFAIGMGVLKVLLTASTTGLSIDAPLVTDGLGGTVVSIDSTDSPYTPGDELVILADCTGGNVVIALPALAGVEERQWRVVKTDTSNNVVTLTPDGAETINGSLTTVVVDTPYNALSIAAVTTTRWQIIGTASRVDWLSAITETYGNGALGDVTIAGSTTAANNLDYLNLTVTGTLTTARYAVWVLGRISGNGTITGTGNSASGSTAGAALSANFLGGGNAGGNGGVGANNGSNGGSPAVSLSATNGAGAGDGGTGGTSGGGQTPGSAGNAAGPGVATGGPGDPTLRAYLGSGSTGTRYTAGAGGSGGGSQANSTGGGGGGGGTNILIRARLWNFTGTVESNGGAGADAVLGAGAGAGGGGGGGGGSIMIISDYFIVAPTMTVTGGAAGASVGAGGAATAGGDGYTRLEERVAA